MSILYKIKIWFYADISKLGYESTQLLNDESLFDVGGGKTSTGIKKRSI